MNGDGASGLAWAIALSALAIVLAGGAAFYAAARIFRAKPAKVVALLLAGLGMGLLGAVATFHEALWSPPPALELHLPDGFRHRSVILLQSASGGALVWSGAALPFSTNRATVAVPPSGVVRIRDFGPIAGRADLNASAQGARVVGVGGGPAAPETGADAYIRLDLQEPPASEAASSPEGIAAEVRRRETSP